MNHGVRCVEPLLKALSLSKGIELEIIRVLAAGDALKEISDYELHRLTTQNPALIDETVRRYVECLEKEIVKLQTETEELAKEIEELTGESAAEILSARHFSPRCTAKAGPCVSGRTSAQSRAA